MEENYKPIKGYEDLYEVSDKGNVRTSLGKTTYSDLHGKRVWKQRILKPRPISSGHLTVQLYKNKRGKDFLIHRLVAMAFIENPNNLPCINHKDSNPKNNNVENLEWCTYAYNNEYSFQHKEKKNNIFVTLIHKETRKEIEFNSMAKASRFLSRNSGWISNANQKYDKIEDKNYEIKIHNRRNGENNGN